MSKIQEALNKIQASRAAVERGKSGAPGRGPTNRQPVLGALADLPVGTMPDGSTRRAATKRLNIDREALRDAGLIAPEYHEEMLANQYREIKRPLLAHAFGRRATKVENGNLIIVTSAVSGEGKTFTSINLALSIALERDHTVLFVDGDVAKPRASSLFGLSESPGLLDILEDSTLSPDSVILDTDVERLSILPAGEPRQNSTELLSSSRMDRLVSELISRSPKGLVVFDSPPLLQTSEAKILALIGGQIVMVVRAEQTPKAAVLSALGTLEERMAINLVLNQARSVASEYQYGYGASYGAHYKKEDNDAEQPLDKGTQ